MNGNIFRCKCGCGIIAIDEDEEEGLVYLSYYVLGGHQKSGFYERLKLIWYSIIGKEYLFYDVVIDKKEWDEICLFSIRRKSLW